MNSSIYRLLFTVFCLLLSVVSFAQDKTDSIMLSNGKMYVVVAVCLTILIGLFMYVFIVDRKVSRLEKRKD